MNLEEGNYYFGATYEANYQLNQAYIFAASEPLATADIPTLAMAYAPISDAGKDNTTFNGIYFELDRPQDILLGFQANLNGGADQQEFRASKVTLIRYTLPDGIHPILQSHTTQPYTIFDLSGRPTPNNQMKEKTINLVDGQKVYVR